MMTDPIADMLTRIRNAQLSHKKTVEIPFSKLKKVIVELLSREGYVGKVEESGETHPVLIVELKYNGKKPVIQSLKRESKPGHRVYLQKNDLPKILNDYGIAIISTSKGIMTNKEARAQGIGGEIICSVY
ncbi:MAG TPA: 30S ribosomal protein S8 [Candidatus Magasanikbacteria bacterium]|jgi:small subunit ribosomal protein S8|nr:30S ribosomal protein S8 [Candidatus Magasanikbacteria bacterium]HQF57097.1 30S ribosomal protein S8 [Candidatus Magasanikbacteria bacterium]HQL52875.1 30S ribosomal protein S8 [Candidatus Magasanikbacteria bacterium]